MHFQTIITAPAGMSPVNVFRALWEKSEPALIIKNEPATIALHEETVSTPAKVAELIKTQRYLDYEGGRLIKVDFSRFPQLGVNTHDKFLGIGTAQKAIEEYNLIPSSARFDKSDSFINCLNKV